MDRDFGIRSVRRSRGESLQVAASEAAMRAGAPVMGKGRLAVPPLPPREFTVEAYTLSAADRG